MNVWSPSAWKLIGRSVFAMTNVNLTHDQIEQFIDIHDLWRETPEIIAYNITKEILHERN